MRERYLEAFDTLRIDCLNGDKYKTGKIAPDGTPDPSIFSTEGDPVGIQVGTAIATLVRKADHKQAKGVRFRQLWGQSKREELMDSAEEPPDGIYERIEPVLPLGLPFVRTAVSNDWFEWPSLPDLFPASFPGVQTGRDAFLVDTDLQRLRARVADYFDPALNHEDLARRNPRVMTDTARFDAKRVRETLLARGGPVESGFVRYAYRPFDIRWLYWEAETKLLREKSPRYPQHVFEGNLFIEARERDTKEDYSRGTLVRALADNFGNGFSSFFPMWLGNDGIGQDGDGAHRPNLSATAQRYLDRIGLVVEDLFHHVLNMLHDPAYRSTNAGALRMGWPRIPLPGWPDGKSDGSAEELVRSAAQGRELAALLDLDVPVTGTTQPPLSPQIEAIAEPATIGGRYMTEADLVVTAGWGRYGPTKAVMPGKGCVVERDFSPQEREAMRDALPTLGDTTFDVYLNGEAYWRNIPAAVWNYRLGGYQVLKKWLSYRESAVLGRSLSIAEAEHFRDSARRIGSILLLTGPDARDSARTSVQ